MGRVVRKKMLGLLEGVVWNSNGPCDHAEDGRTGSERSAKNAEENVRRSERRKSKRSNLLK